MSKNKLKTDLKILAQSLLIIFACFFIGQLALINIIHKYGISDISLLSAENVFEINVLKIAHIFSSSFSFILPALLISWIIYKNIANRLMLDKNPNISWYILASLIMFTSMPFLNLIIQWNENITFPDSLSHWYNSFRQSEDYALHVTNLLLANNSGYHLLLNIFVMALLPAIGEEFLFRGIIMRYVFDTSKNVHIAIWSSAFLFSAIHFQFFGFIPRMILGAFFGYLVYFSGSLLLAIWAHFFNNAMAIITHHFIAKGSFPENSDKFGSESSDIYWVIISIALTSFLIYTLIKKSKREFES